MCNYSAIGKYFLLLLFLLLLIKFFINRCKLINLCKLIYIIIYFISFNYILN